jgi:hypothetical protein
MTYQDRTSSTPYFDRFREYEPDEKKTALEISRISITIELTIDTDITNYDSHQIVLTHPEMDGALTFDVTSLSDAEDRLDSLDYTMRDDMTPPKKVEPTKPYVSAQPYVAPIRNPPPKPSVQEVKVTATRKNPEEDLYQNPVGSMIGDVIEICQLFGRIRPKVKNINNNFKK